MFHLYLDCNVVDKSYPALWNYILNSHQYPGICVRVKSANLEFPLHDCLQLVSFLDATPDLFFSQIQNPCAEITDPLKGIG